MHLLTNDKLRHLREFPSPLSKSSDAPFRLMLLTHQVVPTSAILYRAETWWISDFWSIDKPYLNNMAEALGVSHQMCTSLVCRELKTVASCKSLVKRKYHDFLRKWKIICNLPTSSPVRLMSKAKEEKSRMSSYLIFLENVQQDLVLNDLETGSTKYFVFSLN